MADYERERVEGDDVRERDGGAGQSGPQGHVDTLALTLNNMGSQCGVLNRQVTGSDQMGLVLSGEDNKGTGVGAEKLPGKQCSNPGKEILYKHNLNICRIFDPINSL